MKFVIVPQDDLDRLEEARRALYKTFPDVSIEMLIKLGNISQAMWKLTHKKYPMILWNYNNEE